MYVGETEKMLKERIGEHLQDVHQQFDKEWMLFMIIIARAVEIPCPTCPTWSHFIQDKLKISIYLSLDKYKCIKLIQFCIPYFD